MDDRPDPNNGPNFGPDFHELPLRPEIPDPPKIETRLHNATQSRPPAQQYDLRDIARFAYCHNPFYCISAIFVLWGLVKSFHFHGSEPRPELLMSGLAGYALLLAAVACLLIHAGQLWEDIRTILLLIVIIFLASSMSFDEDLAANQGNVQRYYWGGLAIAVIVSELVLRGAGLRLPMLYRLPYYATLALFFLYPLFLAPWMTGENDPRLLWRLAGFSPLAGLVTLTLLPAGRRGASYVRDNGSPWQWPWYPWPLFVVLLVGMVMRCYTLCVSFLPSKGPATLFEPYLLVPLFFAVNVLLLECGIHARRPKFLHAVMAAPLALVLLSTWTFAGIPNAVNLRPLLLQSCGCSPLFLTLIAATTFYTVALLRRVPHAVHWLTLAFAMFAVIGPTTVHLSEVNLWDPKSLRAWPIAVLAIMQLLAALRSRSGLHWMLAATYAVAALCLTWPDTIAARWHGAVPAHLLLISALMIGALLGDAWARFLGRAAFTGVVCAAMLAIAGLADDWSIAPGDFVVFYPGVMFLLAGGYGYWVGNRWYRAIALMILAVWASAVGSRGYGTLRMSVAGLDQITLGMACLLVGFFLSLWKIRLPQAWWHSWNQRRVIPPPIILDTATDERR